MRRHRDEQPYDLWAEIELTRPRYEIVLIHKPRAIGGTARIAATYQDMTLKQAREAAERWITQAPENEPRKAVIRETRVYATFVPTTLPVADR
jgi:hypothetical protein